MYNYLLLSQVVTSNPDVLENSFSFTCNEITIKSNIIKAKCLDMSGNPHESKLRNWKQCSSDIANINGILRCQEDYLLQENHKSDSFLQTCVSVTYSGQSIEAICQKVNRTWEQTQLLDVNTCSGNIANFNGSLHCKRIISEDK